MRAGCAGAAERSGEWKEREKEASKQDAARGQSGPAVVRIEKSSLQSDFLKPDHKRRKAPVKACGMSSVS